MTERETGKHHREEDLSKESARSPCEIITMVSGKGGTGKTLFVACLAYALQEAGQRVCLVDTDLATQGLSLFILGPGAERGTSRLKEENSLFHMVRQWGEDSRQLPVPKEADRGDNEDHGTSYQLIISNKQFYDKRLSLGVTEERKAAETLLNESMGEVSDEFRANYRVVIKSLFEKLSQSGHYDYVIVDTRGGFGEISLVPAVFSDSFLVISEPDFTSFHQLAKLLTNIDLMSLQENRSPYVRGVIVNKATSNGEEEFRSLLDAQFGIGFGLSWPIPLDPSVIDAYREQLIPYRVVPEALFSSASLRCFTDIFDLVTIEWSREGKARWRALVKKVEGERARAERGARWKRIRVRFLIYALLALMTLTTLFYAFSYRSAMSQYNELKIQYDKLEQQYEQDRSERLKK